MKQEVYEFFQQHVATYKTEIKYAREFTKTTRDLFPEGTAHRAILNDALTCYDLAEYAVGAAEMHFANLHFGDVKDIDIQALLQFISLALYQMVNAKRLLNSVSAIKWPFDESSSVWTAHDNLSSAKTFAESCCQTIQAAKKAIELYR